MRGTFITFYGINNIGKTTHAQWLVEKFQQEGYSAVYIKYPHYDLAPSGPLINSVIRSEEQYISEEELQMWYTINRFQFEPELKQLLTINDFVVAEDYVGTGLAWGHAKGVDLDWLKTINRPLISEDISIMLDGERFLHAKEKTHVHENNDALMKRCREVHLELAKEFSWPVINTNQSKDTVRQEVWEIVTGHSKFLVQQ